MKIQKYQSSEIFDLYIDAAYRAGKIKNAGYLSETAEKFMKYFFEESVEQSVKSEPVQQATKEVIEETAKHLGDVRKITLTPELKQQYLELANEAIVAVSKMPNVAGSLKKADYYHAVNQYLVGRGVDPYAAQQIASKLSVDLLDAAERAAAKAIAEDGAQIGVKEVAPEVGQASAKNLQDLLQQSEKEAAQKYLEIQAQIGKLDGTMKALTDAVNSGKMPKDAAEVAAKEIVVTKKSLWDRAMGYISKVKDPAAKKELMDQGADGAKDAAAKAAAEEASGKGFTATFLKHLSNSGTSFEPGTSAAAAAAGKLLNKYMLSPVGAIVGMGAAVAMGAILVIGSFKIYQYLSNDNELADALSDSSLSIEKLKFVSGSFGERKTNDLIEKIRSANQVAKIAQEKSDFTESELQFGKEALYSLSVAVDEYLKESEAIHKDLIQSEESESLWNSAIEDLQVLQGSLISLAEAVKSDPEMPDTRGAGGEEIGTAQPTRTRNPNVAPVTVKVYGQDLDITHLSPEQRSAAPRVIQKVLNDPTGMAFVDPDTSWGGWGGYMGRKPTTGLAALEALRFLIDSDIQSPLQLRKFMNEAMPKAGKKRHSGWRDAIKHYRKHPYRPAIAATAAKQKIKNNDDFDYFLKYSINNVHKSLKMSENYQSEYFTDMAKGVSDTLTKSYYAGLKGMYDQGLDKRDADVGRLYHLHDETGPDLITEAHPKSIVVLPSMGKGGLVENGLEQKESMEDVALSAPSGNFRSRYSWVLNELVKIANQADTEGQTGASDLIDQVTEELIASLRITA